MRWLFVVLFIFLIHSIYAACTENQININSAQLKELDNLYGIGEAKAQAIIDSRPYTSVDNLINAKGIGEITLQKIKEQNLACVDKIIEEDKKVKETVEDDSEKIYFEVVDKNISKSENQNKPIEIIKLNKKDIKTKKNEENKEEPNKNHYPLYGLMGFCLLLGFLFILRRKKYKNEFD